MYDSIHEVPTRPAIRGKLSKMASVEDMRTRVTLQEHGIINVSGEPTVFFFNCITLVEACLFSRHTPLISLGITMDSMTRGVRKNSRRLVFSSGLLCTVSENPFRFVGALWKESQNIIDVVQFYCHGNE